MESDALKHLQALTLTGSAKTITEANTPLMLVHKEARLESLESYMKNRSRFRGTLSTSSLKDFSEHVVKRKGSSSSFVSADSADNLSCTTIFNIGTEEAPGHCDDRAILTLKPTAGYEAVRLLASKQWGQKELAEMLEDWAANLKAFDRSEDGQQKDRPITQAIVAIRKITVEAISKAEHNVGDMSASRTAMDQIAATSSESLPAGFTFSTKPYEGLQERHFALRLSVLTGDSKPRLSLRIVQREAIGEEIKQEFKDLLKQEIGGASTLVLGSFDSK